MTRNPRNPVLTTRVAADLLVAATTVVGTYVEIGRLTAAQGQAFALGYGFKSGQDSAEGRIYWAVATVAPAAIDGRLRVMAENPAGRPVRMLFEADTTRMRNVTAANPATWLPLSVRNFLCPFGWSIVFQLDGTAAQLINIAASVFSVDFTEFEID